MGPELHPRPEPHEGVQHVPRARVVRAVVERRRLARRAPARLAVRLRERVVPRAELLEPRAAAAAGGLLRAHRPREVAERAGRRRARGAARARVLTAEVEPRAAVVGEHPREDGVLIEVGKRAARLWRVRHSRPSLLTDHHSESKAGQK